MKRLYEKDNEEISKKKKKKITVQEPKFKPKHRKPMSKKYFRPDYNGFEPKPIEFEMFYNPMQYIGFLNMVLRAGENQKRSNRRTDDNYCIFKKEAIRYGNLEHRREIRKVIIRYTNKVERSRKLPKDALASKIGYIEYKYDKFASEIINEKVIEDAVRRMEGINSYMNGRAYVFCSFIINDSSRKGLRMIVFGILK